ncbi:hypothetical protein GIB67_020273 [Kingdonia uniflora]|uniref:Cation/H+ exchanger domain-containing protein n=1 Tax=Kingdonia uniflora TaxID=39325 RepID=A0A7J7P3S9_9MAGN|nr:hypothetical protein GIB67_020273 [Kingdonia uniflora]
METLISPTIKLASSFNLQSASRYYVCSKQDDVNSRGLWFGDDPLEFSMPLLLLQLSLISIITRAIYILLKPLGQPMIVSQIVGGIILGPSILGRSETFSKKMFPLKGRTLLETLSVFGFMFFLFLIGVKMDPTIIFKSGKRTIAIGFLGFFMPYSLGKFLALILNTTVSMDSDISSVLEYVASAQSMTAFPVIACFLAELKILNSELGRLATSSSIICDICSWSVTGITIISTMIARERSLLRLLYSAVSTALFFIIIMFLLRPAVLWVVRQTPEGKPIKEGYLFAIIVAVLVCGLIGEVIGLHALLGPFLLGLVIPDGPPLGAALEERLDSFVSQLLMPIFFTICGLKTDVFAIQKVKNVFLIQFIVLICFLGKIVGTILPPLYCRMPVRDAISLALIMNSKGIVELATYNIWRENSVLNDQTFSILVISVVIITGFVAPLVRILYDPSRRYLAYKRRTILHSRGNTELGILACVHNEENVPTIIKLLEASNPTKESTITVYVLHLVQLAGRASSLLVAHRPHDKSSSKSDHIIGAFRHYEQCSQSTVSLQTFTGISPFDTMHDDVCSLALEKRTSLIIVPFHKTWMAKGIVKSSPAIRNVNYNVLDKAPCSVGILVDRRQLGLLSSSVYSVAVLFFGGADDREALSYGGRMAENINTRLAVIRFSAPEGAPCGDARSRVLDNEIFNEFRLNTMQNDRVCYHEEVVTDGAGVMATIRSMEKAYDLVMVGRRHKQCALRSSLTKWNECVELGKIGDIFASQDFDGQSSVLVVQQQARVWGMIDPEHSP